MVRGSFVDLKKNNFRRAVRKNCITMALGRKEENEARERANLDDSFKKSGC